jgi:hypothetical protein
MTRYVADGTKIARGDGASPEVFTDVPQVTSITPVGQERSLIDVTNLDSAAREYMKAIKDGQEINIEAQYDPDNAVHSGLRTDLNAETSRNFRVTFTDSPAQTVSFAGMVTNWSIVDISIDNVLTLNVTIKPTGDLTFA